MNKRLFEILAKMILITLLFFPFIRVKDGLPGIEVIDILLPVLLVLFIKNFKLVAPKKIYFFLAGFCAYILLTIAINSRLGEIRDYFELVKIVKFGMVIFLFSYVSPNNFLDKWIRPVFIALVLLNFVHYYELFRLNYLLEHYYQAGERMSSFGKNSLGYPTTKRMLGFACNPNYNGIIFLFFAVYFIPKLKKKINKIDLIYFGVAVTMVFLCQSRTALLSTVCILIVYGTLTIRSEFKKFGFVSLLVIATFGLATVIAKVSINSGGSSEHLITMVPDDDSTQAAIDSLKLDSLNININDDTYTESLIDGSAFASNSLQQRLAIWKHLWGMIMKKPVFGHGPYKEYFYDNKLYSESEYFMITWRYGFIGLLGFLLFFIVPIRKAASHLNSDYGLTLLLFTVVLAVSCSTNNPFSHKTIIVLYGIYIGSFIYSTRKLNEGKENTEEANSEKSG